MLYTVSWLQKYRWSRVVCLGSGVLGVNSLLSLRADVAHVYESGETCLINESDVESCRSSPSDRYQGDRPTSVDVCEKNP